jgi:hypothetical protein
MTKLYTKIKQEIKIKHFTASYLNLKRNKNLMEK